jgi:signal transduction histidine kinase
MAIFTAGLFIALSLVLGFIIQRARRLVRLLLTAQREERRLLHNKTTYGARLLGLDPLIQSSNALMDQCHAYASRETVLTNQIESTLGAIEEVVLIFNKSRLIQFSNGSAEQLFNKGQSMRGARLGAVLRSSSLLEFLDAYEANPATKKTEIFIEREGEKLWFEASCAEVLPPGDSEPVSTLLVLHDITQLKGLELVRREFVANVSHELRTPLTIIKGFADTLVDDHEVLPPESRLRFLKKIINNSERLHSLVEDLLNLSRLESHPEQIEKNDASLLQLFEETLDNNRKRLKAGQQEVYLQFDPQIKEFAFDSFKINQVLDNLVENVFRYAPNFTSLKLQAELDQSSNYILCCVADDGPGIPQKDLPHIFERFYRVDKGRSRERGGTGLGLSIMKHIVQLHEGMVWAESEIGKGTQIYFRLPYKKSSV